MRALGILAATAAAMAGSGTTTTIESGSPAEHHKVVELNSAIAQKNDRHMIAFAKGN
jgi:hypothetical protein